MFFSAIKKIAVSKCKNEKWKLRSVNLEIQGLILDKVTYF